jgi:hypothetical protein
LGMEHPFACRVPRRTALQIRAPQWCSTCFASYANVTRLGEDGEPPQAAGSASDKLLLR